MVRNVDHDSEDGVIVASANADDRRATGAGPALWTAVPPSALILIGVFSVQFGAGLAAKLFTQIPPAAVTGLRLWTSAAVMAAVGARPLRNALTNLARSASPGDDP